MKRWLISIVRSLRVRLFIILLLVGTLPILILQYGILENYEEQAVEQRVSLIRSRSEMIARELSTSGVLTGADVPSIDTQLSQLGSIWNGRVVVVNSRFMIIRDTFGVDQEKYITAREVLEGFQGIESSRYNKKAGFLEVTVPVVMEETREIVGLMIISIPTNDIMEGKASLSSKVYLLQVLVLLMVLVVAFYAAKMLVRPFGKVTAYLDERSAFLDEDISIPEYTETRLLAEAYNRMRQRLRTQEEGRQEFVSNVSHELKTPLASMKVLSDSLITQEEVPNELYREFMTDIAQEIDRENAIITDLLDLVKMDRKSRDINIKETNINELTELILKRLRPIAASRGIELVLENYKPILAQVDETKLTLALTNLVENGIKYNHDNGWVHVSLNMDNSFFYVKVEDSGMGIPEEDQARIFERFYRVDKSHSREIGGTGLGLAITKSSVEMHGGAIRVFSKEGEGTTFTLRIPLRYDQVPGEADTEENFLAMEETGKKKKKRKRRRKEKRGQSGRSESWLGAMCILLLSGLMLQSVRAQGASTDPVAYRIYYTDAEGMTLIQREYVPASETFDDILEELLDRFESPQEDGLVSLLPAAVNIHEYIRGVDELTVDFNASYLGLSNIQEILLRAGLVKTLVSIPGVMRVSITVDSQPLLLPDGTAMPAMSEESFVDSDGNGINSYRQLELVLYFSDPEGKHLIPEVRSDYYSSNFSLEQRIVEQIIAGPQQEGLLPVTGPDVLINDVQIDDHICVIDLDSHFGDPPVIGVDPEICLYAFVQSICSECDVTGVKFLINGSGEADFMGEISLDQVFTPNEKLIVSGEERITESS